MESKAEYRRVRSSKLSSFACVMEVMKFLKCNPEETGAAIWAAFPRSNVLRGLKELLTTGERWKLRR